jgi:transcriptional regulator with XRE-family HTH domain
MNLKLNEKIRILCVRNKISISELARRLNQSPQNFSAKLIKESFSQDELNQIAKAVGATFEISFILKNGDKI